MRHFLITLLIVFFIVPSNILLGNGLSSYSDTTKSSCIQAAARRLDEALSLMQKHYYKKENVNWDSLITAAKIRLLASGDCEDALQTVNWCFRQINELHSFLMPTAAAALYNYDTAYLGKKPRIAQLVGEINAELMSDKGIAYISIPWIGTSDSAICTKLADSLQQLIAGLDRPGVSKWIIDLRKNTGGNCWPMLAGIGPLLGEGICAYFISPGEKIPISYRNGAAMQGSHVRCSVSRSPYKTKKDKKWIIVLTGPKTSSSGEILALAFKGKEQAYQYGEPTAGLTTANTTYTLSDNSMLILTICMEADRTGKVYDGKINPDQIINPESNYDMDDPVKSAAIMWLHIQ